ncbi:MAG TPA: hypothetical protein VHY19_03390 [Steroidobacteraceae bacterium]|jgi:hypothetical protein|nr:hypothetical protein [Steroidobacteraceae bacterium]
MLLDEIITILSDSKGSLTDALLKTKVLLYQLGKKDLVSWVNSELSGYTRESDVPPYRIIGGEVRGHVVSIAWQQTNFLLPINHLKEPTRTNITEHRITMSIQSIEEAVEAFREKGTILRRNLPTEFCGLFKKVLLPGVEVNAAWCDISMIGVENVISEVRSRLLDFALELKDAIGADVPEKELPKKAQEVQAEKIFSTAIYNSGTVILGSTNIQVNNQQGDIEGLVQEIAKLGYQQSELEQLRHAVTSDRAEGRTPDVTEGATAKWFGKALKEAGKGVVKVGVDVAASVITKAIEHFATGG